VFAGYARLEAPHSEYAVPLEDGEDPKGVIVNPIDDSIVAVDQLPDRFVA